MLSTEELQRNHQLIGSYASLLIVERNTSVGNVPMCSASQTAFSAFSDQLLESANLRKIAYFPNLHKPKAYIVLQSGYDPSEELANQLKAFVKDMWTLFIIFALMPMLIFIGLTAQRWLFKNVAEKHDLEWERYRQRYD